LAASANRNRYTPNGGPARPVLCLQREHHHAAGPHTDRNIGPMEESHEDDAREEQHYFSHISDDPGTGPLL